MSGGTSSTWRPALSSMPERLKVNSQKFWNVLPVLPGHDHLPEGNQDLCAGQVPSTIVAPDHRWYGSRQT